MTNPVIVTDLHWGARNNNLAIMNGQRRFFKNTFFPYLDEHPEFTEVWCLGDTFDKRSYTDHLALSTANESLFDPLLERGIHLTMLVGNHDMYHKNNLEINTPSLFLGKYPNVTIITEPTELQGFGKPILAIPWICADNAAAIAAAIGKSHSEVCIGHLELTGFEMHRGQPSTVGLDAKVFRRFDTVLTGHFHHKSSKGNIHYLGTPYEMTWADLDDPRGFHILHLDQGNKLEFIENPDHLFKIIVYDDTGITDYAQIKAMIPDDVNDSFIKVVVKGKSNPSFLDKLVGDIECLNPVNAQVIDSQYMSTLTSGEGEVQAEEDILSTVFSYLETKSADNARADELKKMLTELYVAAQQSVVN